MLSVAEAEAERASPLRNYELCQIKSQLEHNIGSCSGTTECRSWSPLGDFLELAGEVS